MNVIEIAEKSGFDTMNNKVYVFAGQNRITNELNTFADLLLQKAMDELKTQADYSGSNRRAFYMDAIEVLRKFKDSV